MEAAEQLEQHKWLQRLVGEWTYEFDASPGPGKPPVKMRGTETVRSIGNLWVLVEAHAEAGSAGPTHSLFTLGFDADKGRFVGSFISSTTTLLWIYDEESLDAVARTLTMRSLGPGMAGDGKPANYEDVFELGNDTDRSFRSRVQQADGTWVEFMRGTYRRVR